MLAQQYIDQTTLLNIAGKNPKFLQRCDYFNTIWRCLLLFFLQRYFDLIDGWDNLGLRQEWPSQFHGCAPPRSTATSSLNVIHPEKVVNLNITKISTNIGSGCGRRKKSLKRSRGRTQQPRINELIKLNIYLNLNVCWSLF